MKNREKYAEEIKSIIINGNNDINLCNKIIKPIILKQNNIILVVYHVAIVEHYKYYGLTKNMKNQKLIGLMCLLIR